MQTTFPPFANGTIDGLKKVAAVDGAGACVSSWLLPPPPSRIR